MSERLRKLVINEVSKLGAMGVEKLAVNAGVSPSTVRNVENNSKPFSPTTAYKLAKACGCTDQEAISISNECLKISVARTA